MNPEMYLEIEKKYDLYHAASNDVNYWVYYRFNLWNHVICGERLGLSVAKSSGRGKKNLFKMFLNFLRPNRIPLKTDILFFDHERRLKSGKYYECIYTDDLNKRFNRTATLEIPFQSKHFVPTKTPNLIFYDRISFSSAIYRRLFKLLCPTKYRAIQEEIRSKVMPALHEIKESYGCIFSDEEQIDSMVNYAIRLPFEKKAIRRLLTRLSPRLVVVVVSYGRNKMLFVETAKELGIPVIELQHGTMHEEHIAYHYAKGEQIMQFPDKLFLFSDFWKRKIQVPIPDSSLIPVGYPYYEKQAGNYRNHQRKDKRYTVLFITQKTIGSYLADLAVELYRLLPESDYRIIFKLHPAESENWNATYPDLENTGIEVITGNSESVYYYFAESDMQIGVYSTAIYEGLGFNLKTLILKVGHYEVMQDLVNAGYASFIESADDVLKAIHSHDKRENDAGEFWKTNALNNIVAEIHKIDPQIILTAAIE